MWDGHIEQCLPGDDPTLNEQVLNDVGLIEAICAISLKR